VVGTVTDPARAAPVEGARVFLFGTRHSALTNAEGAFRIEAPLHGRFDLAFSHPALTALELPLPRRPVTIRPGEVTEVHLLVPVAPRVQALVDRCPGGESGAGTVTGTVRDPEGVPLPGVQVTFSWEERGRTRTATATTGTDGRYLSCRLPVEHRIHARARFLGELGDAAASFTIARHGYAERDLWLRPEPVGATTVLSGGAPGLDHQCADLGSDRPTTGRRPRNAV
jgi:hypothetical protein